MTLPTIAGVQSRIFTLPGRPPFMIADYLAEFYQVTRKRLMEQVRRNQGRFPEGFIFEMTEAEYREQLPHFAATAERKRTDLTHYGFTEMGALQLSSVLTGPVADAVSVIIVRAFVTLRDGQIVTMRREWAIDKQEYIGRSKMRQRIMAAADAGDSYSDLHGRWTYAHRALASEIEAMRVRGYITALALTVPLYILRDLRAKKAFLDVHAEDTRQMKLFGEAH